MEGKGILKDKSILYGNYMKWVLEDALQGI